MFSIEDYNYDLPEENIAQHPVAKRDQSRLFILDRESGTHDHKTFHAFPDYLSSSDVLVLNNTKVIPARLVGRKETGGRMELLLLDYDAQAAGSDDGDTFESACLMKASKRPAVGSRIRFGQDLDAEVIGLDGMQARIKFYYDGDFESVLNRIGKVPLPPYIRRSESGPAADDYVHYQTIYASQKGSVAAPTAGLHFSNETLARLREKGVNVVEITLHVGYGTFSPVRSSDIRKHVMHSERFTISEKGAAAINEAKGKGHKVIAVGTTCVRSLEFSSNGSGQVTAGGGACDLFIYPGYGFRVVDAMVTNFHLPKSTLLMLVSALAGRENILDAYRVAIESGYRFYSYGDAMLII